jgi:hypothetical protein
MARFRIELPRGYIAEYEQKENGFYVGYILYPAGQTESATTCSTPAAMHQWIKEHSEDISGGEK